VSAAAASGRRALTALRLRTQDAVDRLGGQHDPLLPPRRLRGRVGDGDFEAIGEALVELLRRHGGLEPNATVLDAGCGCGRVARVLSRALGDEGRFVGFDIDADAIAWCTEAYADDGRFSFAHADLRNAAYGSGGGGDATAYRFPLEAGSADVVLMASLITHLLEDAADHYLAEAARVLRPGGRLVATVFALDGRPDPAAAAFAFGQRIGVAAVDDPRVPEAAVAYDATWLLERLRTHGLRGGVVAPGGWHEGRAPGGDFQDVLVGVRRDVAP
jgi:SAM-dependent methyltransferase